MIKRGDRKQFKEFVCYIKDNKHRYNQVRIKLNKLIEGNVDLNQKGYMGKTLLHIAVKLKDKKLMQYFMESVGAFEKVFVFEDEQATRNVLPYSKVFCSFLSYH